MSIQHEINILNHKGKNRFLISFNKKYKIEDKKIYQHSRINIRERQHFCKTKSKQFWYMIAKKGSGKISNTWWASFKRLSNQYRLIGGIEVGYSISSSNLLVSLIVKRFFSIYLKVT